MVKFQFSKGFLYLFIFQFFYYIRYIEMKLIKKYFYFYDSLLFTFLMALGEIVGGSTVYFIIKKTSKKKKKSNYFFEKLIRLKNIKKKEIIG